MSTIVTISQPKWARTARVGGALIAFVLLSAAARAQQVATTPSAIIYPGDVIREEMLVNLAAGEAAEQTASTVLSRDKIVGKMARRTLLPGQPIFADDVGSVRLVQNGSEVTVFYAEDGVTIVTTAAALEDGAAGDVVRVRNTDSGVVVSGTVQADGSVRVSGG